MTSAQEATAPATSSPYDELPYPGSPFAQTHPDRLATLALLFGLSPREPKRCRVLELGCGDGGNLLPMALALPKAELVGIDSASHAIGRAEAVAGELGLRNIRFEAGDIEDFQPEPGSFDYVTAHGVYSWVPEPVRDRLLAVCGEALSEQGVAYVSYNALPGGRLRQGMREMLGFHTEMIEKPAERVAQARALLRFLRDGWPEGEELAGTLGRQAEQLLERDDATIFHDELSPVNEPVYFHQFAAHAAQHGLQYVAEADFFEMQTGTMPEQVAETLGQIDDPVRREQYLDFLKGRMFRQTLLCHEGLAIDRTPRPRVLERLAVSSPALRAGERDAEGRATFEGPTGSRLTTDQLELEQALERIGRAWPAAVWIEELLPADDEAREAVCTALLRCFAGNLVQLHAHPPELSSTPGERPATTSLARLQARSGVMVTNLRHASVRIEDDAGRRLLSLLDGTRDREALLHELAPVLSPVGDPPERALGRELEQSLQGLAYMGLLADGAPLGRRGATPRRFG